MNLKQAIQEAVNQMSQSELEQMGSSLSNLIQTMEPFMVKSPYIQFNFNVSIQPEEMEPNTIYLDGSCRGYHQDHQKNSISFDHHIGCVRFITLATCQQVYRAIQLGFNPLDYDQIVIDDIDGDTVLSCFVLRNPEIVLNEEHPSHEILKSIVDSVGLVDSIGAVTQKPHPIHHAINPQRHHERTEDLFGTCYTMLADFVHGRIEEKSLPEQEVVSKSYVGIRPASGSTKASYHYIGMSETPMEEMYIHFPIVLAAQSMTDKQTSYTLGKKSDFVKGDFQTIFQKLGEMELEVSEAPELISKNWGGADTIGGSAWYKDGSHSRLEIDQVSSTIMKYL